VCRGTNSAFLSLCTLTRAHCLSLLEVFFPRWRALSPVLWSLTGLTQRTDTRVGKLRSAPVSRPNYAIVREMTPGSFPPSLFRRQRFSVILPRLFFVPSSFGYSLVPPHPLSRHQVSKRACATRRFGFFRVPPDTRPPPVPCFPTAEPDSRGYSVTFFSRFPILCMSVPSLHSLNASSFSRRPCSRRKVPPLLQLFQNRRRSGGFPYSLGQLFRILRLEFGPAFLRKKAFLIPWLRYGFASLSIVLIF